MNNPINNKEEIIKLLAKKYNKSYSEVENIVTYQYKFLNEEMQSGSFKNVMLMHIGKWFASENKKKYWQSKYYNDDNT